MSQALISRAVSPPSSIASCFNDTLPNVSKDAKFTGLLLTAGAFAWAGYRFLTRNKAVSDSETSRKPTKTAVGASVSGNERSEGLASANGDGASSSPHSSRVSDHVEKGSTTEVVASRSEGGSEVTAPTETEDVSAPPHSSPLPETTDASKAPKSFTIFARVRGDEPVRKKGRPRPGELVTRIHSSVSGELDARTHEKLRDAVSAVSIHLRGSSQADWKDGFTGASISASARERSDLPPDTTIQVEWYKEGTLGKLIADLKTKDDRAA